ncbi:GNAT family N-acetyltransferase [Streptacidiphilus monticola]|uniref:GNAT family N-acetyltransferase n=1 Tax=Streptacidiphilus monticola TaxID=2161674 RepID=A0ABW1FUZ4_9ACTN
MTIRQERSRRGSRRPVSESGLDVVVAESVAELDLDAWSSVVEAAAAPVQYTASYLRAYEAAPLSTFTTARYLRVVDGDRTLAVLPLYLQERPDPYDALRGAGLPIGSGRALLGHNWYCYDTQVPLLPEVGARPALRDRVLRTALCAATELGEDLGAPVTGLVNVAQNDPLLDVARRSGWQTAPIVDRFQLPLAGLTSHDDYLATLGPRTRRTVRQYLRRAADAGVTTSVTPPTPATLRTVCALSRRTAAKYGSAGMYPEEAFVDFVMRLREHALVVRVDLGPQTLAAAVVLLDAQRLHMWVGGTSHATVHSFSPNYLLWATEIGTAIELGKAWVEGGRANRPMKERHGMRALPLFACLTG